MNIPRRSFVNTMLGLLGLTYNPTAMAQEPARPKLVDGHCPVCSMKGEQRVNILTMEKTVWNTIILGEKDSPTIFLCQHCGCVFGYNPPAEG